MSRDDIIRMARHCDLGRVCGPLDTLFDDEWESLHRFAMLAAAHEREACAKVCFEEAPAMLAALQRLVHPMADDTDLEHARDVIARATGAP